MRIDVWSDLVCPWCYIGKRRLERALAAFPDASDVEVVHRSFQLNPSAPMGATSRRRDYLMTKYAWTASRVADIDAQMEQRAAADGLEYHLSDDGVTGNTLDAHRLVHLARERGVQGAAVERFFRAYFTEQRSIFDVESLVPLAVEAGLDETDARRVLAGADHANAVREDASDAQALGLTGVPLFVFDRRLVVSGAQPIEIFVEALTRAAMPPDSADTSPPQ